MSSILFHFRGPALIFKNPLFHLNQTFRRTMSSKKALIVLTEGAEEMELVITTDVLRRAQIDTIIAGLNTASPVKCSRNVVIVPDKNLKDLNANDYDAFILPGGMKAAETFAQDGTIGSILKQFEQSNKLIAVICASPIALEKHGIGLNKRVTSHPSVSKQLTRHTYCEDRVVNDNGLITSRAPGTAFEFALEIVKTLVGQKKVQEISPPMLLS